MKSKAHHKKCTELGIVPVPTSVEDSNIDEDSLARQESLKKLAGSNCGNNEPESDLSDEEDDEDEDEDEDVEEEEDEADETGQFEDADAPSELAIRNPPGRNEREQVSHFLPLYCRKKEWIEHHRIQMMKFISILPNLGGGAESAGSRRHGSGRKQTHDLSVRQSSAPRRPIRTLQHQTSKRSAS